MRVLKAFQAYDFQYEGFEKGSYANIKQTASHHYPHGVAEAHWAILRAKPQSNLWHQTSKALTGETSQIHGFSRNEFRRILRFPFRTKRVHNGPENCGQSINEPPSVNFWIPPTKGPAFGWIFPIKRWTFLLFEDCERILIAGVSDGLVLNTVIEWDLLWGINRWKDFNFLKLYVQLQTNQSSQLFRKFVTGLWQGNEKSLTCKCQALKSNDATRTQTG